MRRLLYESVLNMYFSKKAEIARLKHFLYKKESNESDKLFQNCRHNKPF